VHHARHANWAVIPANAGIHSFSLRGVDMRAWAFGQWIPAFAGMTRLGVVACAHRAELRRQSGDHVFSLGLRLEGREGVLEEW